MFKKHPAALPFLFFSEMWERFGYYLMIGIFTLYLKDVKDGFQMNEKDASNLYGTFIALVFFTPFLGGLLRTRTTFQQDRCQALTKRVRSIVIDLSAFRTRKA